jgi:hypothetical protein
VLKLVRDTALARSRLAEIINSWTAMELDVMTSIWVKMRFYSDPSQLGNVERTILKVKTLSDSLIV